MTGDYADLRALAEAATPGPWKPNMFHLAVFTDWPIPRAALSPITANVDRAQDCDYIAAANPARILALLADLDAARAEAERLGEVDYEGDAERGVLTNDLAEARAERDALAAKVEAVRALPLREWDESDADSIAANAARAYNQGVGDAVRALGDTP